MYEWLDKIALKISGHRYNWVYDTTMFLTVSILAIVFMMSAIGLIISLNILLVWIGL